MTGDGSPPTQDTQAGPSNTTVVGSSSWVVRIQAIQGIAATVVSTILSIMMLVMLALLLWLLLSLPDQPAELGLIAVLGITMTSVISASFITAWLYRVMNRTNPSQPPEDIFWSAIYRFSWLAAPIATGFGVSQIIKTVTEALATP